MCFRLPAFRYLQKTYVYLPIFRRKAFKTVRMRKNKIISGLQANSHSHLLALNLQRVWLRSAAYDSKL